MFEASFFCSYSKKSVKNWVSFRIQSSFDLGEKLEKFFET